jgi:hypothetical protein
MDLTTKLNIARTEQRIALLRNLIATLASRGKDVSEHRRMLAAEERYLASGCAPPETPETLSEHHRRPASRLHYASGGEMSELTFPMRLTPTERLALEHIRADRPVNTLVLERAVAKGWVKRGKPPHPG